MRTAFCMALAAAWFALTVFAKAGGDTTLIISQVWLAASFACMEGKA